jgi:hypothetical protein
MRVDKVSTSAPRWHQSVKRQAEGKTTVLEMMVTKELGDPFRRDALSKPVRHLDKYKNYVLRHRLHGDRHPWLHPGRDHAARGPEPRYRCRPGRDLRAVRRQRPA